MLVSTNPERSGDKGGGGGGTGTRLPYLSYRVEVPAEDVVGGGVLGRDACSVEEDTPLDHGDDGETPEAWWWWWWWWGLTAGTGLSRSASYPADTSGICSLVPDERLPRLERDRLRSRKGVGPTVT